ncbi:hypothetical protein V5O48_018507 [Marasmius crinis-equi]|uniref:Uncharacterized protein n=1 Tax=Marasmius crinis-equi TaxID=585013 RepID=A0ABR3EKZ2_9AGAR
MPHKRAKRSVREKERAERGHDLAPTKSHHALKEEAIPKSAARVLNAMKIREDFRKRKREAEEGGEGGDGGGKRRKKGKDAKGEKEKEKGAVGGILPGESLEHYNKRVETTMRPLVRSAVKTSLAVTRGAQKQEELEKKASKKDNKAKQKEDPPPEEKEKETVKHERATEFQTLSTSAPKRLNDIVQAPPEMPRLRKAEKIPGGIGKSGGVVSMAQKAMMEEEREKAIRRYRELKARRTGIEQSS